MNLDMTDDQMVAAVVENLTEDANNLYETFRSTDVEPDDYTTFAAILKVLMFYRHEWVPPVDTLEVGKYKPGYSSEYTYQSWDWIACSEGEPFEYSEDALEVFINGHLWRV